MLLYLISLHSISSFFFLFFFLRSARAWDRISCKPQLACAGKSKCCQRHPLSLFFSLGVIKHNN
jgi:hypothetical protein